MSGDCIIIGFFPGILLHTVKEDWYILTYKHESRFIVVLPPSILFLTPMSFCSTTKITTKPNTGKPTNNAVNVSCTCGVL